MSQFESPPPPPTTAGAVYAPSGPPPYSGTAIGGFVCALLGCTIVGAILGLILGIVGIVSTKGGRRRGMGLAIAAIPISLLFGAMGVGGVYLYQFGMGMVTLATEKVPMVLGSQAGTPDEAADKLLELCDSATRKEVGKERAVEWIKAVREKHGTMTSISMDQQPPMAPTQPQNEVAFTLPAKFVNGPATIQIIFSEQSLLNAAFQIKSIAVDDLSLRGSP